MPACSESHSRCRRILIGGVHDHLRRPPFSRSTRSARCPALGGHAGLRLERSDLAHAEPVDQIDHVLVVTRPAARPSTAPPRCSHRAMASCPAARKSVPRDSVVRRVGGIDLRETLRERVGRPCAILRGSSWMCGLPAAWMSPSRAIEPRRHFEPVHTNWRPRMNRAGRAELSGCPTAAAAPAASRSPAPRRCRPADRRCACARSGSAAPRCDAGPAVAVVASYTVTLSPPSSVRKRTPIPARRRGR